MSSRQLDHDGLDDDVPERDGSRVTGRLARSVVISATIVIAAASVTWALFRSPNGWSTGVRIAGLSASLVVGAVFCAAGASKVVDSGAWAADAPNLGTPKGLVRLIPWFELVVGALMIVGLGWPVVPLVATGTLLAFSGAIGWQLAAGHSPRCACFGSWSSAPISDANLVRNAVWMGLAILSLVR